MNEVHDYYTNGVPTKLSALDIFKDQWVSAIPGTDHGSIPLFQDNRVTWAIDKAGGLLGKTVLELGPLEAGHTYMLATAGAESVLSIEANPRCFLKCLTVKEVLGLQNAHFLFGDFVPWLSSNKHSFDYIHASGVLYHMSDPVSLLDLLCTAARQIYIWTHYVDFDAMPADDPRFTQNVIGVESSHSHGRDHKLYRRRYHSSPISDQKFCGGVHKHPAWLERPTILHVLNSHGFTTEIEHDAPNHPHGPSCSIFASGVQL